MSTIYRLSASILSADFAKLGENILITRDCGVPWIHIDVMDGQFVPPISFGDPIIRSIRGITGQFFDVHMMVEEPARFIEDYRKAGADLMTVHAEACTHLDRTLTEIHKAGMKTGVALNPATPIEYLDYVMDKTDMVLQMTVNPGYGGQKYIPAMTDKIRRIREKLDQAGYADTPIEVDGGVNTETIHTVLDAGASIIVSGSGVFRGNIRRNAESLMQIIKNCE